MFRYEICDRLSLTVLKTHSGYSTEDDARKRAKQCSLVKRMIDEYYPEAVWSPKGSLI